MIRRLAAGRVGRPLATVIACLYLPFCWLLVVGDATTSYRLLWLKLWPALPGFLPGFYLFHPHDTAEFATMGAVALALIVGLTWLGSHGRGSLAMAAGVALFVSIPTSLLSYAVFRA